MAGVEWHDAAQLTGAWLERSFNAMARHSTGTTLLRVHVCACVCRFDKAICIYEFDKLDKPKEAFQIKRK